MTQRIVSVDLGFINCHQMARLLSNIHFIALGHYTNQMALRWNRPLLTHSHPIRSWNEKVRRLPEGVNWFPECPTTENINSHSPKTILDQLSKYPSLHFDKSPVHQIVTHVTLTERVSAGLPWTEYLSSLLKFSSRTSSYPLQVNRMWKLIFRFQLQI